MSQQRTLIKLLLSCLVLIALLTPAGLRSQVHAQDASWTVMFYTTADTSNIEMPMIMDVNEVEYVGSSSDVNFVAQVDRTTEDPSWTDARRFLLTQDSDWQSVNSEMIMSLGEVNQGEPAALIDFVLWAAENYPAEHYALIMSDHGGGWDGFGWDQTGGDDQLTMPELDQAFSAITESLGRKFDLIGFDACLMSQLEVIKLLAPYADVAVLAEETEPGYGWAYDYTLPELVANPGISAAELGQLFVQHYMYTYSEGEWKDAGYTKYDLNVIDLAQVPAAEAALNAFVRAVQANSGEVLSAIGDARNNAQTFGGETPDEADVTSSADLIHFLDLLATLSPNAEVAQAAQDFQNALSSLVIYHDASGDTLPGANGISVYFPRTQTVYDDNLYYYGRDYPGNVAYMSDWQAFLQTFYGEAVAAVPPAEVAAADPVTIEGVYPSDVASIHNPPVLLFSTEWNDILEVTFSAIYVDESGFQMMLDYSPLESAEVVEGEEEIIDFPDGYQLNEFTWGVEMPVVTDGTESIPTVLLFNRDDENHVTISGKYIYQDGSEVTGYISFDLETSTAGAVWGVSEMEGSLVPFNIQPQAGDKFLPTWRFLDENGEVMLEPAQFDPLTFGSEPFTFSYQPSISGTYSFTIRMEDIAGNIFSDSINVAVNNEGLDTAYRGYTDITNGVNFIYPWEWQTPTFYVDEEGGYETVISNEDGSINITITAYEAASNEDILAIADEYIAGFEDLEAQPPAATPVGGYDGNMIEYTFLNTSDKPGVGVVLAVYVPDTATGYLIDLDTTEESIDAASVALQTLADSLNFFIPPDQEGMQAAGGAEDYSEYGEYYGEYFGEYYGEYGEYADYGDYADYSGN